MYFKNDLIKIWFQERLLVFSQRMKYTLQQQSILASEGNIKINAVAGSGKTTTMIEYAKTKPPKSKILYLAFNKSVKIEAEQKFSKHKLTNVRIETAHSLAFRNIVAPVIRRLCFRIFIMSLLATKNVGKEKLNKVRVLEECDATPMHKEKDLDLKKILSLKSCLSKAG